MWRLQRVSLSPENCTWCSSGITYLHAKGIAHWDVKPANILVSNKHYSGLDSSLEQRKVFASEPILCKVTDFGESRSRATQTASICHSATKNIQRGSPAYMAPEIYLENKKSTAFTKEDLKAIDVWAMGIVFFMLLNPNLRHPFSTDLSSSLLPWGKCSNASFCNKRNPHATSSIRYFRPPTGFYAQIKNSKKDSIFEAYERCTYRASTNGWNSRDVWMWQLLAPLPIYSTKGESNYCCSTVWPLSHFRRQRVQRARWNT